MDTNLITLKQLPVIEQQLQSVAGEVQRRTAEAASLVCTEETRIDVKKIRAQLNGEFAEFESRRKALKAAIEEPYKAFLKTYEQCVSGPYKAADAALAEKIKTVEGDLKAQKENNLLAYFAEYRESIGLSADVAPMKKAGIKVTLTVTDKALREAARAYLDGIKSDLDAISTMSSPAEYRAEYLLRGNLQEAIAAVNQRKKRVQEQEEYSKIEAENRETAEKIAATVRQAALAAPIQKPKEDPIYAARFVAHGTIAQLKKLKTFMEQEGIKYE